MRPKKKSRSEVAGSWADPRGLRWVEDYAKWQWEMSIEVFELCRKSCLIFKKLGGVDCCPRNCRPRNRRIKNLKKMEERREGCRNQESSRIFKTCWKVLPTIINSIITCHVIFHGQGVFIDNRFSSCRDCSGGKGRRRSWPSTICINSS